MGELGRTEDKGRRTQDKMPKLKVENRGAHLRGPDWEPKKAKGPYVPTGKPMGRPRLDPSELKANKKVYKAKGNGKVGVENRGAHLRGPNYVPKKPSIANITKKNEEEEEGEEEDKEAEEEET